MGDINEVDGFGHMANGYDNVPVVNDLGHAVNGHTLEASNKEKSDQTFMPIAICGMACRLPGDISSPTDMWKFLTKGGDARSAVPDTRWNASAYYSAVQKKGLSCTQHGYYLNESVNLGALDSAAFPMSRNEIERMDPQHRLLLEVAHECMDDSGEIDWKGSNIGVYVGSFGQDWYDVLNRETLKYSAYQLMGSHDFMISERISHELDFHGPCLTIRTGCSSSLIALNDACSAIAKGDCKGALVGGTNLILAPATVTSLSELGAFSPDGSSKTFSADANGYARGEGIVAVYVKSLADALRDGNPIRAVVSGITTNFDGKTPTLGRPSAVGQEAAIRRAYEVAGISELWKTGLFECHGTGTAAGDPIEASAIAAVFGDQGIHISSLKPNLGHSEGAAGLSAVLKTVLALQNRMIPPSIKAWPLNPKIPFETAKLTVASECTPWPAGRHERVSINSFGKGGANGHAIIDSAKSYGFPPDHDADEESSDVPSLFVYSAYSSKSLERMSQNIERFLETTTESFADVAYTLARRRQHLPYRSFVVSAEYKPGETLPVLSQDVSSIRTPVMVFTGQGAQWPQMGRDLLRSNRVFSETILALDEELQHLGAEWTIEDELRKVSRQSRVNEAEFSQPLCTAIQIALVETLASVGVKPAAVMGHSSGEIAAAYAAGALTLNEAIAIAFHRGKISKTQTKHGAMAAVGMSWDEANDHLLPGVVIACDNSPNSITLSGDADQLADVIVNIKKARPETLTSILKVERAYHSHHMQEIGEAYHQAMLVSGVVGDRHTIPFFSSVTGKRLATETEQTLLGPKYWQENLESPVRFKSAVAELLNHVDMSNSVFLEIGTHPALEGPIRQILATESRSAPHVPTLKRRQNGTESLLTTIGKLWTLHVDVDFADIMPTGRAVNDLPSYPWDYKKTHWYEPRVSREWRLGGHHYHDLLGRKLPESTDMEPIWRNLLHLENVPWVLDHRIDGDIIFPFAAFLAIAAEAVQQVSEAQETVEMRNVVVGSALPISEESPTELVTAFHRTRLTDFLDSDWWDFTISSHNGHVWTRHCTGQVRQDTDSNLTEASSSTPSQLPRKVDSRSWYEAVHRKRLAYGPHFTTMESISSSAAAPSKALADLRNNWHGDEASYYLHPVVIDSFFQLLSLAAHDGLGHTYRRQVPTSIDHLTISRCRSDQLRVFVEGELTQDGGASGQGQCSAGSKIVSQFSGLRLTLFKGDESTTVNDYPLTARAEWVPHIGFTDVSTLFRDVDANASDTQILEGLVRLAVQNSQQVSLGAKPPYPSLQKYAAWLKEQDVTVSESMRGTDSRSSIESTAQSLDSSPFSYVAKATAMICSNIDAILSGQRDAYDVLATDGILEGLLEFMSEYDGSKFFRELAHFKPNLRVLELGAGSGAATARILRCLRHEKGQNLFSRYVVTDASVGLVDAAKSRFKGVTNLEFTSLNIERDLVDQEFGGEEFDLIIAAGVLHTSTDMLKSLANIRKLLTTKGRLLVQEPSSGLLWAKFILGALPSWWSGQDNSRRDGPFVSQEKWAEQLASAGFGRPKFVDQDSTAKGQSTIMVVQPEHQQSVSKKVTVICGKSTPETDMVCQELQAQGYDIVRCTLYDRPTPGQDIIALVDLDGPFIWDLSEDRLETFQSFANNLEGSGVLWVTRQCQGGVKDPRYAPIIGLIRTMRSELAANFATCETEVLDTSENLKSLVGVFHDFQDRRFDGVLGPEYEYAISNGIILVNRFFPFELNIEIQESHQLPEASLAIGKTGQPGTLHWSAQPRSTLQGDKVEVEVHATGLNFRDVLVATGILTLPETNFGYEAAGIVTKVGTKTTKLSPGDRVTLVGHKTFATTLVLSEMLCEKIPDSMSLLDAAGSPLCFATAMYGLMDIGRVEEGQSVLIHSATGGVGIAAIQVAKMLKADIYVTVGSAKKRKYLIDNLGIPDERISDSRSRAFVVDILRQTKGKGVDVALNSLSGELLHQTWSCIAKWGTMVEIGKRDLLGSAKLDMKPFSDNRNYCCIDLDQMTKERPIIIDRMLRRLMDYFRQGYLQPLPLAQVFPASKVSEAFKYMQQGKHIGKIVVELRDSEGKLRVTDAQVPQKRPVQLDSSAAYLLVGGLGGLGRSTARYMVQQGARNLIFLSRSADKNDPRHQDFIKEIESMGSTVQCVQGNVAQQECVERAIDKAPAPIKGILNMTIAVADEAFLRMTIQDWNTSIEPKVKGTWNILQIVKSRGLALDFLVLISSLSGVIGQAGQANYSSANTFMDAFSQYSASQGLPCTTITSGVMEGIGVMKNQVEILRRLQGSGWRLNNEAELIEIVDSAIQLQTSKRDAKQKYISTRPEEVNKTKFTFGLCPTVPLSDPDSYTNLRADVRMAVFHNSKRQSNKSAASEDELRMLLNAAKKDTSILESSDSVNLLAMDIGKKLCSLLLLPDDNLSPSMKTVEMGLDSLVAVEMGAWWKVTFGLEMSTLEVVSMGTLEALGQRAAEDLIRLYS